MRGRLVDRSLIMPHLSSIAWPLLLKSRLVSGLFVLYRAISRTARTEVRFVYVLV